MFFRSRVWNNMVSFLFIFSIFRIRTSMLRCSCFNFILWISTLALLLSTVLWQLTLMRDISSLFYFSLFYVILFINFCPFLAQKMVNGGTVNSWFCINFSRNVQDTVARDFCHELAHMCYISGMVLVLGLFAGFKSSH